MAYASLLRAVSATFLNSSVVLIIVMVMILYEMLLDSVQVTIR